ncbi:MAG: hypothetical protein ACOZAG_02325 [Patescibacteria group bacterium]
MFREGEVPPEVAAEYERMKGEKNMEKERRAVDLTADKEEDVGSLLAGVMSPEDFVKSVLEREGGDPKRAEMATRSIKEFWLKQLDEGTLTPEKFEQGVYDAAAKMLKTKEVSRRDEEREEMRKERIKGALGRRAS